MPSSHRVGASKSKTPRSKTDYYPTKQEFADGHCKAVVEQFDLLHSMQIFLDVGYGEGVYGNAMRKVLPLSYIFGIDIDDSKIPAPSFLPKSYPYTTLYKQDFMYFGFHNAYDLVFGNPPYYAIQDFFEHAINLIKPNGIVSFLVKSSYLESAIRFERFKKHRPYSVWNAVNRPIGNHAENYVIVNYKKEDMGEPTKMGWLLSNKEKYEFYE